MCLVAVYLKGERVVVLVELIGQPVFIVVHVERHIDIAQYSIRCADRYGMMHPCLELAQRQFCKVQRTVVECSFVQHVHRIAGRDLVIPVSAYPVLALEWIDLGNVEVDVRQGYIDLLGSSVLVMQRTYGKPERGTLPVLGIADVRLVLVL